jgi:small subunit ribosomal protein S5
MSENKQQEAITETTNSDEVVATETTADAPADDVVRSDTRRGKSRGDEKRNPRRARRAPRRDERVRSEFEQKIISIRRVTRVMAGGRRFSFSVAIVIGNKKGKVGVGIGKASDTQLAIEKAVRDARKNAIELPLNKHQHIPHDVSTKLASSEVMIMPAPGRGLVAGSSVRTVLELAGVKDVTAKIFSRSKNKLNNARAAIAALKKLKK